MIKVPHLVLSALSAGYQVDPSGLTYLGGGQVGSDGIVYTYHQNERKFVLKIMAFRQDDPDAMVRFQERLKFVHFLGEHGVPIVNPLALSDGSLYITQVEGENLFVAYTYEKIEGGRVGRSGWLEPIARPWGAAVGALHRLAKEYPTWLSSPVGDTERSVLSWQEEWQDFFDWCRDREVRNCWQSIRDRLEALPVQRDSFGFIHNDPHADNILITQDHIVLLDFDVANHHWFINDVAIALQFLLFRQTGGLDRPLANPEPLRHFLEAFMEGYGWENQLDPFWLSQIDLFIAYRRILMFTVMQDWLRSRSALKRDWKAMILAEPPILSIG